MIAVAALLGLTACGTDNRLPAQVTTVAHPTPSVAAEYTFPVEWAGDYTFRWTAADNIDLETPEAAVVRAFAESTQLAMSVGARLAYPGYADAIPDGEGLRIPDGGAYPPGAAEGNWKLRWAGTFLARIMRIKPNPAGFTAMYCVDHTNVAESYDVGATYIWRQDQPYAPPKGVPMWLTMHSTIDRADEWAQRGLLSMDPEPYRAPNYNVFEGWTVDDVDWSPSARTDDVVEPAEQCTAWTQANSHVNPAYLLETPSRMPADPPPEPSPPLPGWGSRITG